MFNKKKLILRNNIWYNVFFDCNWIVFIVCWMKYDVSVEKWVCINLFKFFLVELRKLNIFCVVLLVIIVFF